MAHTLPSSFVAKSMHLPFHESLDFAAGDNVGERSAAVRDQLLPPRPRVRHVDLGRRAPLPHHHHHPHHRHLRTQLQGL